MTVQEALRSLFEVHRRIEELIRDVAGGSPANLGKLQGVLLDVAGIIEAIQNNHAPDDQSPI